VTEYTEPDLTPADAKRLRAFLAPQPGGPVVTDDTRMLCHLEQRLRADGALLARVAPWALTARLVVRHDS
jgi:hypothetical protein